MFSCLILHNETSINHIRMRVNTIGYLKYHTLNARVVSTLWNGTVKYIMQVISGHFCKYTVQLTSTSDNTRSSWRRRTFSGWKYAI